MASDMTPPQPPPPDPEKAVTVTVSDSPAFSPASTIGITTGSPAPAQVPATANTVTDDDIANNEHSNSKSKSNNTTMTTMTEEEEEDVPVPTDTMTAQTQQTQTQQTQTQQTQTQQTQTQTQQTPAAAAAVTVLASAQSSASLESVSVSASASASASVASDYRSVSSVAVAETGTAAASGAEAVDAVPAPESVAAPAVAAAVPAAAGEVPAAPEPVPVPAVTIDRGSAPAAAPNAPNARNPQPHHHGPIMSLPECLYGPLAQTTAAAAAAAAASGDAFFFTPCPTLQQLQQQQQQTTASTTASTTTTTTSTTTNNMNKNKKQEKGHVISLPQLRKIAAAGIPDDDDADGCGESRHLSCRGVTWRVLLGMLPVETADWYSQCQEKRAQYLDFCNDLFDEVLDVETRAPELKVHRRWRQQQQQQQQNNNDNGDDSETSRTESDPHHPVNGNGNGNDEDSNSNSNSSSGDFVPVTETPLPDLSPQSERSQAPSHSQRPPQVLPVAVKDYWKSKGKDLHVLENLTRNMNALHLQESVRNGDQSNRHNNNGSRSSSSSSSRNSSKNASAAAAAAGAEEEEPWQDFVESAVLLDEIRKDVVRTHPDLGFYLEPDKGPRRYAALERILFVWSKYNKGVRYVQGMNEIVGTIYYVLANDWNDEWADHAEADTYWLLNTLLSEMRDVFISDMDDSDTGIQGRIANMHTLLGRHDPEVKEHLEDCGIDASFYAIRWWTTLLSREFLLPDTIRLWDSMFASTHKDNFLRYFCVTMVMVIREDLLKGDFSTCMRLLQGYPPTHMDQLVESSRALWIYESQLTLACHKGGISLHQALQTISPPPAIIMAFGVRDGLISLSSNRPDPLEEAGEKVAASVRDVTAKVTTSAKGLFGRASLFYNKYSEEVKTRYRTQSADGANDVNNQDAASSVSESKSSADDCAPESIYMDAFK